MRWQQVTDSDRMQEANTPESVNGATTALLGHCTTLYSAFELEAVEDETTHERIWEGHTVDLAKRFGITPGPSYSNAIKALKGMDCIEQKQKGNRHQPTIWILKDAPTMERFNNLQSKDLPPTLNLTRRLEVMEQDIISMKQNIGETDIQAAFAGLAKTIKQLDAKIGRIISKGGGK